MTTSSDAQHEQKELSQYKNLLSQLQNLQAPETDRVRDRLAVALRKAARRVEDENTTQHRILASPLLLIVSRIASDTGIFAALHDSSTPLSIKDLASNTHIEQRTLSRILRWLASQDLLASPAPDMYASARLTSVLAHPAFASGLRFASEAILPCTAGTMAFLTQGREGEGAAAASPAAASSEQDSEGGDVKSRRSAFQIGHHTTGSLFQWLKARPALEKDFHAIMADTHRTERSVWDTETMRVFVSAHAAAHAAENDRPLLVDVGGGNGKTCKDFREAFPELKGRVVNQDQEAVVRGGLQAVGVQQMEYDFFTPQPLLSATFYNLRRVLHNWTDEECVRILSRVRDAMDENSRLIVDEKVVPGEDVHWNLAYIDYTMWAMFEGGLRSRREWDELFERAGLRVADEEVRYMESSGETALVVKKT